MTRSKLLWGATLLALIACHVPAAVLLGAPSGSVRGGERVSAPAVLRDCDAQGRAAQAADLIDSDFFGSSAAARPRDLGRALYD